MLSSRPRGLSCPWAEPRQAPEGPPRRRPKAAPRPLPRAAYEPPPITWRKCNDPTLDFFGARCGKLVVPRNYARPDGKKIRLAVSRVRHTTPDADYQGVMLVNPGGPGGSGLIFSVFQTFIPNGAGESYDWIGFDPRGVGSSGPALACNARFFHGDRPPYRPTKRAIMKRWVTPFQGLCAGLHPVPRQRALPSHQHRATPSRTWTASARRSGRAGSTSTASPTAPTSARSTPPFHPLPGPPLVFDGIVNPERVWYKGNLDQDRRVPDDASTVLRLARPD